jgi:hypothetical protein
LRGVRDHGCQALTMWRGQRPGASSSTSIRGSSPLHRWRCATASTAAATRSKAPGVDREVALGGGGTPLHFDEGDRAPAPGDQVDLAARGFHPAPDDAPAVEPQPQRGEALALAPAPFGGFATHEAFNSSARA